MVTELPKKVAIIVGRVARELRVWDISKKMALMPLQWLRLRMVKY